MFSNDLSLLKIAGNCFQRAGNAILETPHLKISQGSIPPDPHRSSNQWCLSCAPLLITGNLSTRRFLLPGPSKCLMLPIRPKKRCCDPWRDIYLRPLWLQRFSRETWEGQIFYFQAQGNVLCCRSGQRKGDMTLKEDINLVGCRGSPGRLEKAKYFTSRPKELSYSDQTKQYAVAVKEWFIKSPIYDYRGSLRRLEKANCFTSRLTEAIYNTESSSVMHLWRNILAFVWK